VSRSEEFEVLIIGGGPAGLSAALVLARARRRVVVCDAGRPRNAASGGVHGILTRDGILPAEYRQIGRDEVARYGVTLVDGTVTEIVGAKARFEAVVEDGTRITARRVLIATGVADRLPDVEGIDSLYGKSVHHCPYCDGWEWRDRKLAVYGRGAAAHGLGLALKAWSADIVVCTDGRSRFQPSHRAELEQHGVAVDERRIASFEGANGMLARIVFAKGEPLERDALFLCTGNQQASQLAINLGCRVDHKGAIPCDHAMRTSVPGVYVAGDASRDVQFVAVAVAEGAKAAVAIHKDLRAEELASGSAARAEKFRPIPKKSSRRTKGASR
jgi:thioredoxin reductase